MQPDNKHMNDLEYLSQQGFEKVQAGDADIDDLIKKVRTKSFSYNNGLYFAFISLIMGVFIGASLFFAFDTTVAEHLPVEQLPIMTDTLAVARQPATEPIQLDTSTIIKENFINPRSKTLDLKNTNAQSPAEQQADSVISIPEKPIDMALLNKEPVKEEHLKFMANAPVLYIHDLKVTNYTSLYFKKNHFVKFNERPGVSADYSTRHDGAQNTSQLKQGADYFLHEQIAQALLYFKKGKYDECINSLKLIATYNDEDINCNFYMAMCYYYKNNYTKAAELFDKCIGNINNTFLQEAMYYKAVALFEAGDKNEATVLFKQIADEDEFYAEKARGYLK